jgi:hypothetical protein
MMLVEEKDALKLKLKEVFGYGNSAEIRRRLFAMYWMEEIRL